MTRELIFSATKKDFKIDWFSGTGKGGQHRNKHQNCCRLTYLPWKLTVVGQSHRERSKNFKDAFSRLSKKIVQEVLKEDNKRSTITEVIRTYHEPDNRVKDHASGVTMSYDEIVGKNNIAPMIEARKTGEVA